MDSKLAVASAKLSSILNKTELGKIIASRVDNVFQDIDKIVNQYLGDLGKEAVKIAREGIRLSSPGGKTYVYKESTRGDIITTHKSSTEGSYPISFQGTLSKSIISYVDKNNKTVRVTVNKSLNPIGTKAYVSAGKDSPYHGIVIVGGKRKTAQEYAAYLEYGFTIKKTGAKHSRPFLKVSMDKAKRNLRDDMSEELKYVIAKKFKQEIVNHLRIKVT